jgi:hypothetical protein
MKGDFRVLFIKRQNLGTQLNFFLRQNRTLLKLPLSTEIFCLDRVCVQSAAARHLYTHQYRILADHSAGLSTARQRYHASPTTKLNKQTK